MDLLDFDASRPNTSAQEPKSIDPDFYDDGRPRPKWNASPSTWQSHGPQVSVKKRESEWEKERAECITTSLYMHWELSLHTLLVPFSPQIRTHFIHFKINTHAHADILDSTDYLTYLHTCISVAAIILTNFKRKMLSRTCTNSQLTHNRTHFQVAVWYEQTHNSHTTAYIFRWPFGRPWDVKESTCWLPGGKNSFIMKLPTLGNGCVCRVNVSEREREELLREREREMCGYE